MNPQSGIIGEQYGTELPVTEPDEQALLEEKSRAKFSRTSEFKKLKEYVEQRIDFYQKVLPDGRMLTAVEAKERAHQWVIANAIIGEFKNLLDQYENAQEVVQRAAQRNAEGS